MDLPVSRVWGVPLCNTRFNQPIVINSKLPQQKGAFSILHDLNLKAKFIHSRFIFTKCSLTSYPDWRYFLFPICI